MSCDLSFADQSVLEDSNNVEVNENTRVNLTCRATGGYPYSNTNLSVSILDSKNTYTKVGELFCCLCSTFYASKFQKELFYLRCSLIHIMVEVLKAAWKLLQTDE